MPISLVAAADSAPPASKALVTLGLREIKLEPFPAKAPACLALINPLATLSATPPGTPNCVRTDVTVPVHESSALSSRACKTLLSSKYFCTFDVISVPIPKSASKVPTERVPSTNLKAPSPTPAAPAVIGSTIYFSIKPSSFSSLGFLAVELNLKSLEIGFSTSIIFPNLSVFLLFIITELSSPADSTESPNLVVFITIGYLLYGFVP